MNVRRSQHLVDQVLLKLASDAVKFAETGGWISRSKPTKSCAQPIRNPKFRLPHRQRPDHPQAMPAAKGLGRVGVGAADVVFEVDDQHRVGVVAPDQRRQPCL